MAIDQFGLECDRNAGLTSKSKKLAEEKKTEKNCDDDNANTAAAEMSTNESANNGTNPNEMETLYWHTHGSLLWQR